MSNELSGGPEIMLAGGGTTARFNGARLRIVRGRTIWTVPVRAFRSAELNPAGAVRITISGAPSKAAQHGLGRAVELQAPNARAAAAFLEKVTAALARTDRAADGHALVRVETQPRRQLRLGPRAQAVVRIAYVLPPYALLLFLLGLFSPLDRGTALRTLIVGGVMGLVGGIALWRVFRRIRSLWLPRKRGVGVVGKVTGDVQFWDEGGHLWVFSQLTFTTIDGQQMRDIPSVVTVWCLSDKAYSEQVELNYDPEQPNRASRPLTVGFVFRTLLLASAATIPAAGFVLCVLVNLPF